MPFVVSPIEFQEEKRGKGMPCVHNAEAPNNLCDMEKEKNANVRFLSVML